MARAWNARRHIKHVHKAHACLDCRSVIQPGEAAEAVCGRDNECGFWHGYIHPFCSVATAYEEYTDYQTEVSLTGGDMWGREAAWEDILSRLGHGGEDA